MVMLEKKRTEHLLKLAIWLVAIVLCNLLASRFYFRADLTEEKRFSIKPATKQLLADLDEEVFVEVYLAGNLNADFKRFQQGVKEVLDEFVIYSNGKVRFVFDDPTQAMDAKARNEFMAALSAKGITPTQVFDNEDGKKTQKIILPGAVVNYAGAEKGVMLLRGNSASTAIEKINQSIEGTEYELASAIAQLSQAEMRKVGLLQGHGELSGLETYGLQSALAEHYAVEEAELKEGLSPLDFDALVIAKPTQEFSELDKFYLDQYIMKGGKALFMVDRLDVNMDSIGSESNFAFPYNLNLDDLFFRYGVRINADLVQDLQATSYPIVVGDMGGQPQIQMMSWPFFPLISKYGNHFSVKNLDAIATKFTSTMDTVKAEGVSKTPLLFSSPYSRHVTAPVKVTLNDMRLELSPEKFNEGNLVTGYLLEGNFTSLFRNRLLPDGVNSKQLIENSQPTKIVIVSDGDLAANVVNPKTGEPMELGFDPYAQMTFANKQFILNTISYLVDGEGLISARAKEVKIRPLDSIKLKNDKLYWQLMNMVLPILVLLVFGVIKYFLRRRKYIKA